jgi:hypothetical protein
MNYFCQMFVSTHYGGEDLVIKFGAGEPWKKVFGPVFIYINSTSDTEDVASLLWNDAKRQVKHQNASSRILPLLNSNAEDLIIDENCLL